MAKALVHVPHSETAEAINYIANYESKAISYLGLVAIIEGAKSDLSNEVARHLALPACKRTVEGFVRVFSDKGFATVEQHTSLNGRIASYYAAAREDVALPPIGTLLEWSDHYSFPLITALSSSPSRSSGGPVNTLQIFEGLLTGKRLSETDLPGYKPHKGTSTAHNSRLESLVESGLVQATEDPNTFSILNPVYRGKKPIAMLSEETQAIYTALDKAKQIDPTAKWTAEQITRIALEDHLIRRDALQKFRELLGSAISTKAPRHFPGVIQKINIQRREYLVAPAYREMVADLVGRVIRIDTDTRYASQMKELARATYDDAEKARRIMQRGMENSPYRKTL